MDNPMPTSLALRAPEIPGLFYQANYISGIPVNNGTVRICNNDGM
jgi:hypothetical protein